MSSEKSNELMRNRTRDLQAFSIVPQPTTLPRVSINESACIIPVDFSTGHVTMRFPCNFEDAGNIMYGKKGRSLFVLKHAYKPVLIYTRWTPYLTHLEKLDSTRPWIKQRRLQHLQPAL
jgi:hypothetical protein